ncbi:hypothetical protein CSU32_07660 [Salmonella enterica subsp. diarizonae]|nr:hypothetical protein [Salmonella enterica subsp. diarizonae]
MSLYNVSAYNVYYVKYAGFVVKFMRTSLSGTYRRISRLLSVSGAVVTGASRRNTSFPLGSILLDF